MVKTGSNSPKLVSSVGMQKVEFVLFFFLGLGYGRTKKKPLARDCGCVFLLFAGVGRCHAYRR